LAYIAAYSDIKETYGNDYAAVAKHYEKIGINEGRNESSKELIEAREAAEESEAGEASEENKEHIETTTYESGLKAEDYYDAEGELTKTVHYLPNGNVITFRYGHIDGSSENLIHTTYNGKDFTYMREDDANGKTVMDGQYWPAIGMVFPQLDSSTGYRFDLSVNDDGNYVFNLKRTIYAKMVKGIYTYDPDGNCLTQPE
jgi:hypothetical protein